jgi:uncharacterized protein
VISDVSDKMLEQFLTCVSDRFGQGLAAEEATPAEGAAVNATAREDEADTEQTIELEAVPAAAETAAATSAAESSGSKPAPPAAPGGSEAPPRTPTQRDTSESTLNVLSTVGPVVLKRYGPALAVVALLIFIVIKIIRRKH